MNNRVAVVKKSMLVKMGLAALVFVIVYMVADFLLPVLLGIALSFVLYPIEIFFRKITVKGHSMPRIVAILLSFFVFGIGVYLVIVWLLIPLFKELNRLIITMPGLSKASSDSINALLKAQTSDQLPSSINGIINQSLGMVASYVMGMARDLVNSTIKVARSLLGIFIVPFLSFYFLKDWWTLKEMFVDIFPKKSQPLVQNILKDIGNYMCAYVKGMFQLCLVAGISLTAVTSLLGVEFPLILGSIAVIVETIPLVGPVLGSIPAVFIAYSQSPSLAVKVAIFYLIYYQLDSQVIMPHIMGKSVTLHPVIIILGVLAGGKLFGVMGVIFAVPAVIVCKVLYQYLWHRDE